MSTYEAQSWQVPARPTAWEQSAPQSKPGMTPPVQREEVPAFGTQVEEVDRALDNLHKSGKFFNSVPSRRESIPMMGVPRPYTDFDPRLAAMSPRQPPIGDYDQMRSHSASSLQHFYASQRHQPRSNEAEPMMQAKRRMAAQRERELRNYHQEQQYNRNISTQGKADRAISPNTMNEEDRRELIARQHRALYGNDGASFYETANFGEESNTPRPSAQPAGTPTSAAGRGPSPHGLGLNQAQPQSVHPENQVQYSAPEQNTQSQPSGTTKGPSPKPQQPRSRANSTSSPISNPQNFSLFENTTQQSSRTSTSSPGGSPPRQTKVATAPIGTRPTSNQATVSALSKRATTPLPSPLSYGFAPAENPSSGTSGNERSTSAASNTSAGAKESGMGSSMTWGGNSGVWGKNSLGVQASVWG